MKPIIFLAMVLQVSAVWSKSKPQPNLEVYCLYLNSYLEADELIKNESSQFKKRKLAADKADIEKVLKMTREAFQKDHGKAIDDKVCKAK
jgi:hypothetical protein